MRQFLLMLSVFYFSHFHACFAQEQIYTQGMVVSENRLASQIGVHILRQGGNAIDAAVAVGYALAVVNPCCGNIGGGGFMTIHFANGKNIALNFREKAPLNATQNMFLDKKGNLIPNKSTQGYPAVAVPGTVLGLNTALEQYGSMNRQQVIAPAIQLAKQGYIVTAYEANQFRQYAQDFQEQPNVAAIFLKDGKPYTAGERLIQTDLANTLELIVKKGAAGFYHGPIAQAIITASQAHGGKLSLADFAHYQIEQSAPTICDYRNYTIITAPINSGGPTLCDMLNTLQKKPLRSLGYYSPQSIHEIIQAMGRGFDKRNHDIKEQKTFQRHELTDTTHYSVVDKLGNAVSVTYTLNGFFGARVIAGNTGFFLNNEMDDFTAKAGTPNKFNLIQSSGNHIQPGKRPLSSMAPTIVLKNGHLFMVLGSPGGPRIITAILLTLLNVIDYDLPLKEAVDAPRIHYQRFPASVDVEPKALSSNTLNALMKLGYRFTPLNTWSAIEAIQVDANTGELRGANDYRRPDGAALGS